MRKFKEEKKIIRKKIMQMAVWKFAHEHVNKKSTIIYLKYIVRWQN